MIQIKNKELDKICKEHWEGLKLKIEDKYVILHGKLSKAFQNKIKDISLEKIITSTPDKLTEIVETLGIPNKRDKEKLSKIFDYKNFIDERVEKYSAYNLAMKLKVDTCPYCNRQYTFSIRKQDFKIRPDFDHFFDKADYPYLGLSFYNLIPSCTICNSRLKHSKKFSIEKNIHPLIEGFGDQVRFTIKFKEDNVLHNPLSALVGNSEAYTVAFWFDPNNKAEFNKRACGNIDTFKLKQIYNHHKDYVNELIVKANLYNNKSIQNIFRSSIGKQLFSSENEIKRLAFGNYTSEDDLGKRPLAKLTRDILIDLQVIT